MTNESHTAKSPTPSLCRRRAKEQLALPDMRLHLILTSLLCLTFVVGGVYMVECAFSAVPWAELYEQAVLIHFLWLILLLLTEGLFLVFFALPILFGAAMIFQGGAMGRREPLSTLLFAFGSFRAYGRSLGIMLRLLLLPVATLGICALLIYAADRLDSVWLALLLFLICALLLLAVSLLCCRDDAVMTLAYRCPNARVCELFRAAHRRTSGRLLSLWRFKLRFIGWALLSVASLGVILILHALPYFSLCHTLFLNISDEPSLHE